MSLMFGSRPTSPTPRILNPADYFVVTVLQSVDIANMYDVWQSVALTFREYV